MVRDRLAKLERERGEVLRLIASLDRRHSIPAVLLSGRNLTAFTHAFTERLHSPNSSLRKAYIRQLVDRVEVAQSEIRISGSQAALAKSVVATAGGSPGVVPTFVPEWWRTQSPSNRSPAPNSLLTGKLTGNFAESGLVRRFSRQLGQQIQCLAGKFPAQRNRELLGPLQGIFAEEQRIFSVRAAYGEKADRREPIKDDLCGDGCELVRLTNCLFDGIATVVDARSRLFRYSAHLPCFSQSARLPLSGRGCSAPRGLIRSIASGSPQRREKAEPASRSPGAPSDAGPIKNWAGITAGGYARYPS
jgi:hypothetical protein